MKLSTTKLALVCFLWIYFSLSSGNILAQEVFKREVDFDIDQEGMSIKGSLSVALQFTFFGYPYLKAQYSDLVIDELIYDNEVYNANTNRDIISMPFRPEKGGYPVKMSINVVIPVEANNSKGFEIRHMLPAQFFTITDNIYTISDTYSNDKIDQYFKDFDSPKYHDSHFWENSTLGNITPITVQSMTSSIPRQMTMIIDAKLRESKEKEEKESEKKEGTDKEKEEDDFDDFLNGGIKVKNDKKNTDDNFDDFLSGKKNVSNQKTSQVKSKDDFDEFLNGEVKKGGDNNTDSFDGFLSGEITAADRNDYRIRSKDGKQGVTNEEGKILIPYRKWNIIEYDPLLGFATIKNDCVVKERDSYKNGSQTGTSSVETCKIAVVNSFGKYVIKPENHARVYAGRVIYMTLTAQTINETRSQAEIERARRENERRREAEKKAVDDWAKRKEDNLIRKYESLGYVVRTGEYWQNFN